MSATPLTNLKIYLYSMWNKDRLQSFKVNREGKNRGGSPGELSEELVT